MSISQGKYRSTNGTQFSCVLVLSLASVLFGGHLQAACNYIEEVRLSDPFQFGKAYIESLYYVNSGSEKEDQAPKDSEFRSVETPGDLVGVVAEFLYAMKLANAEYECAVEVLKPYMKSQDERIRGLAEMAATIYGSLVLLNLQIMDAMTSGLDTDKAQPPGKQAARYADLRFGKTETWKGLFDLVAPASTYVFADMTEDPWSGKLKITSRQRSILLEKLEKSFGPEIKGGLKAGQTRSMGSAALLHYFLSGKQLKGSDEPQNE